jgi:hypothetical protein
MAASHLEQRINAGVFSWDFVRQRFTFSTMSDKGSAAQLPVQNYSTKTDFLSMSTAELPRFISVLRPIPSIKTNRLMRLGSTYKTMR